MTDVRDAPGATGEGLGAEDEARRELLKRLGRLAAYTAPATLALMSSAHGFTPPPS
jgi:hypothetical protein